VDTEYAAQLVERRNRVRQDLVEAREHEIADRVTRQCAVAAEAMLQNRGPQSSLRTVRCQRRQGHS
jgi:hypothetical protein